LRLEPDFGSENAPLGGAEAADAAASDGDVGVVG
jgi:hypothetical protein